MVENYDRECELDVELTGFFAGLTAAVDVAKQAQAKLDRVAATQFSVFSYFEPVVENDLSRIFVDLLCPTGSHGQGDRFLRLFLDMLQKTDGFSSEMISKLSSCNLQECQVHREMQTQEHRQNAPGRIDIVLEMPNNLWIGIENKPWAVDQDQQIEFYLKDLRKRGTGRMLYFSKDGKNPTEWPTLKPEARDRCLTVPYRRGNDGSPSVEHWIEECRKRCDAEVVRWLLKDLLKFIRREFEFRTIDVSDA